MKLDIKHWQLLEAIDQHGTLGQAAVALGISQSALSHRLAEAERRLGSAIFEREGRVLRLTPAGRLLSEAALHYLPELKRAEEAFQYTAGRKRHLVKLGLAHYSSYHWVAGFVQSLPVSRDQLQIDFVTATIQSPIESLRNGATDLLLYPGEYSDNGIESSPLFEDELVLVLPNSHPIARQSCAHPSDLLSEDYLTYSITAAPGFEYEQFFSPAGVFPQRVQVVEMTDAIVELVIARQGVSILSRWALTRSLAQNLLSSVPLTEAGLPLTWNVLTRISDRQHPGIQLARRSLQQFFSDRQS